MKPAVTSNVAGGVAALLVAPLAALLCCALWTLPPSADGLTPAVENELPRAGVRNPVTAVLLNFRAYDTMLEIAVLLIAILGAQALARSRQHTLPTPRLDENVVLTGFVRIASPVLVLVAGYLLWVGGHAPGGAFQAGAILASLGIILSLCGVRSPAWFTRNFENLLLVAGLAAFLGAGIAAVVGGGVFLEYPEQHAKWLILAIEAASTLAIGATLTALFAAGRGRHTTVVHGSDQHS
jgi:multisubunit Na+/H+ antiporter MnhB subunit